MCSGWSWSWPTAVDHPSPLNSVQFCTVSPVSFGISRGRNLEAASTQRLVDAVGSPWPRIRGNRCHRINGVHTQLAESLIIAAVTAVLSFYLVTIRAELERAFTAESTKPLSDNDVVYSPVWCCGRASSTGPFIDWFVNTGCHCMLDIVCTSIDFASSMT